MPTDKHVFYPGHYFGGDPGQKGAKMNINIQSILIPAGRPLDAVEQYYRDLFIKHMTNSFNYIPQKGETIGQWLCKAGDYRFYNPKKFQSSEGFCFTVSKKGIKIISPMLKINTKSKSKSLTERWTDYTKTLADKWELYVAQGGYPTGYYYRNRFPLTYGLRKAASNVPMHTVTLLYARPESEWESIVTAGAIHHIIPMDWDNPPYISNYAKNLQAIEKGATHIKMHKGSEKLDNENWEQNVADKSKDFSKTVINGAGNLTDIFEALLGGIHLDAFISAKNEDGKTSMLQHFDDVSAAVGSADS